VSTYEHLMGFLSDWSQKTVDTILTECIMLGVEGGADSPTSVMPEGVPPRPNFDSARPCQFGRRSRPPRSLHPNWHIILRVKAHFYWVFCISDALSRFLKGSEMDSRSQ
jgi:hypothetical protein